MITSLTDNNVFELIGKSTDTKPTYPIMANGSTFIEMDTSKVFVWDKDTSSWTEFGINAPGVHTELNEQTQEEILEGEY